MHKKAIIFLMLLVSSVFAQDANQELSQQFRRGLDFYFINGFDVAYKFGGCTTIGYRLRVDAGLSLSDNKEELNSKSTTTIPYSNSQNNNYTSFSFDLSITPQIYFNLFQSEKLLIQYGLGSAIEYDYYRRNGDQDNDGVSQSKYTHSSNVFYLGVGAFFRAEVKATEDISLYAESSVGASREWKFSKKQL